MTAATAPAIAAALASLRTLTGVAVTVHRGALSASLNASPSYREYEREDGDVIITVESWDWLITAADYVLDSAAVEPAEGDRIVHDDGTTTRTYEVVPLGDGGQCFTATDPGRLGWRVHSRLVTEAAS